LAKEAERSGAPAGESVGIFEGSLEVPKLLSGKVRKIPHNTGGGGKKKGETSPRFARELKKRERK